MSTLVRTLATCVSNRSWRCNHACKDKTKCRHLWCARRYRHCYKSVLSLTSNSCRDGLAKPPPITKKKIEMLIAAECSSQSVSGTTQFNEDSHKPSKSKPKPRPKDNSKPTPQSERSLKQLEALHERMGVEKSLQLGGGSRIKLKHDLTSEAKPARRPVPKFDVEFSQVAEKSTAREPLDIELSDTDSDDDLPGSILDALKKPAPEKKPASSDSADYANSEFDALIAELPLADGVQQSGGERLASASAGRTGAGKASGAPDTMDWTPATPSKKREQASPQPSPSAKRARYTRSSSPPIEVCDMSPT